MKNLFIKNSLTLLLLVSLISTSNSQNTFSDVSKTFKGHRTSVNDLEFNTEGTELYTCGGNNQIIVFDANSGEILRSSESRGNEKPINYITLSYNDKLLAWSAFNGNAVSICNPQSFDIITKISGFHMIADIKFSPKYNNITIVSSDNLETETVSSYDAETGLLYVNYFSSKDGTYPTSVNHSSDGELIACGFGEKNEGIKIWDFNSGKELLSISSTDDINMLEFSPDNKYIAGASSDNNVYIWDIENGELIHTLKGLNDIVETLDYSPDGKTISAAGFDHSCTFKTWNTETGELIQTIGSNGPTILSVEYHPKASSLAVAYTTYGDLFEVPTVKLFYTDASADEIKWYEVRDDESGLVIDFPAKPETSTKSDKYYKYYDYKFKDSGKSYQIRATKYLYSIDDSKRKSTIQKRAQKFDAKKTNVQNIDYSYGSHPGFEKIGYVNNLRYHSRTVFIGNVLYSIKYADYKTEVNSEEERFFDSFQP